MRSSIMLRALVWLVVTASASTWAKSLPENTPKAFVSVIEQIPQDKLSFSNADSESISTAFLYPCQDEAKHYGLVPFNSSSPAFWFFNRETESVESDSPYEVAFFSNDDIDQNIDLFLTSQPEANKGSWTRKSENLCYVPNGEGQTKHYCLKGVMKPTSSPIPTVLGNTESNSASNGYFYGIAAVVLFVVAVAVGYAEYKIGWIRKGCYEYWNM